GAGEAILTASQAGDAGHTAAADERQTLQVAAKRLTVTANGQHKVYGDADPDLTYIAAGFVAGDDETVLTGALARDPGADIGGYAISQGDLDAGGNYVIDFTGADFTITPRPLTVTSRNHSALYKVTSDNTGKLVGS